MRTLVLIKPDGVKRRLVGESLKRFEKYEAVNLAGLKILNLTRERAEALYGVHKGKPFFPDLMDYITSGPIVAVALEIDLDAENAIKLVRKIVGATNPINAEMGSIRGDFGFSITENIVHASDSNESAGKELPVFFTEEEYAKH